ncbi:hypothetical protein Tco_0659217 [Tanacetum coccineum]
MINLTTFAVMCKAYGGEPSIDLLRSFLSLGRAGDWLTLSNRGGADVPKALIKPITHLENWKDSLFYIENKIIPYKYLELLLEDNKLDKKSFKDKIPVQPQTDPLYTQISTYPCSLSAKSVNNETSIIDAEPISIVLPLNVADNIIDSINTSSDDELPPMHPSTSSFLEVGYSVGCGGRSTANSPTGGGSGWKSRRCCGGLSGDAGRQRGRGAAAEKSGGHDRISPEKFSDGGAGQLQLPEIGEDGGEGIRVVCVFFLVRNEV